MSYADGSGGPLALRTSPLASELPLTCEALPFAGGASAPYLPGCARQLFIVRCAHYARGASLSTFGFVTIVPRYLLPQVIPSHSFAALTALIVRRVKATRPLPALAALIVRRVKAAQPLYPLAYYFKSFPTVSFHCFVSGSKVSSVSSAAGPTYILHLFPSGRPISLLPPRYAFSSSGYWKISNQY